MAASQCSVVRLAGGPAAGPAALAGRGRSAGPAARAARQRGRLERSRPAHPAALSRLRPGRIRPLGPSRAAGDQRLRRRRRRGARVPQRRALALRRPGRGPLGRARRARSPSSRARVARRSAPGDRAGLAWNGPSPPARAAAPARPLRRVARRRRRAPQLAVARARGLTAHCHSDQVTMPTPGRVSCARRRSSSATSKATCSVRPSGAEPMLQSMAARAARPRGTPLHGRASRGRPAARRRRDRTRPTCRDPPR